MYFTAVIGDGGWKSLENMEHKNTPINAQHNESDGGLVDVWSKYGRSMVEVWPGLFGLAYLINSTILIVRLSMTLESNLHVTMLS